MTVLLVAGLVSTTAWSLGSMVITEVKVTKRHQFHPILRIAAAPDDGRIGDVAHSEGMPPTIRRIQNPK